MLNDDEIGAAAHAGEIVESGGYMVPATQTLTTLERLSNELFRCTTALDAKRIIDVAEAVKAWTRTQKAAQALHRDATAIATRAERRLGELVLEMRPTPSQSDAADVLRKRRDELQRAGLSRQRVKRAEMLATLPKEDFEESVARLQCPTPNAVLTAHGERSPLAGKHVPTAWRTLATDAIAILDLTIQALELHGCKDERQIRARVRAVQVQARGRYDVLRRLAVDLNTGALK